MNPIGISEDLIHIQKNISPSQYPVPLSPKLTHSKHKASLNRYNKCILSDHYWLKLDIRNNRKLANAWKLHQMRNGPLLK